MGLDSKRLKDVILECPLIYRLKLYALYINAKNETVLYIDSDLLYGGAFKEGLTVFKSIHVSKTHVKWLLVSIYRIPFFILKCYSY